MDIKERMDAIWNGESSTVLALAGNSRLENRLLSAEPVHGSPLVSP